jgi:hypothetical protein
MKFVTENSLLLYIRASENDEETLKARAKANPKPLYYRFDFLKSALAEFLEYRCLKATEDIDPDDFVTWIFPRLVEHRRPRYNLIGQKFGYAVDSHEVAAVRDEADFHDLVCLAITR